MIIYCVKQSQRKKHLLTFVNVTDSYLILGPARLQAMMEDLFIRQVTGTFESTAKRKTISRAMLTHTRTRTHAHTYASASVDVDLIAATSQITKQAFCAKEFSAGVYIPLTARFLSPLPSTPTPPPSPIPLSR